MATLTHPQTKPQVVTHVERSRFVSGIFLSALSGVMLLLSFPPYGIWLLAWIGFVPYLFAQYRLMPLKWSSLAVALANLLWLGPFLARLFGTEVGFFFTYLGVWIAILSLLISKDRNFHEITHYRWLVLFGMFSFVGFEMIRATFIPLVATSAFVGYTQAKQAWLIQPISIFSVYGFDLLILLVNYSLALGVIAWFDRHWQPADASPVEVRMAWKWLAIAGGVLVAWVIVSLVIFNSAPSMPTVRVATLRPNLPLPAFQDEVNTSQIRFDTFAEQAREAAAQGAQVLYTPEMMFNFDPQVEFTEQFRAIAKETGAHIFITYTVAIEGQPWRNEAVLLTPQGEFLDVYGKNHAFGEPPTAINGVYPVYDTPLGRLATLICHDANYTDVMRNLAGNGAQIVAAPISEFGGFGEQFWTNALFRAVENRTAMVVTGVANVSAIINPDGSLVALDIDADGSRLTLVGDVTLGAHDALYTSLGDILGWVSLAGFVFFMFFQSSVQKKAKKAVQRKSDVEPDQVLRQRDWSEQELLENGFRHFKRRKYAVLVHELPPEEAPLKMLYGEDVLIATAGYMICFSAGWRRRRNLYDYDHWPVAPDHFADTYLEWDDPTWRPNGGEKHLVSLGCKPYYNTTGVWAKKLTHPQWIQNPEQNSPFEVPAGAWLILGSKGSTMGVPMWSTEKDFKWRFTINE